MARIYTPKNRINSSNAGWSFEAFCGQTSVLYGMIDGLENIREDGREGHMDLILTINGKRKRAEVKMNNFQSATLTHNDQYNCANGFKLCRDLTVTQQLKNYLKRADMYIVAQGVDNDNSTAQIQILTRKEAFDYFFVRLSFKSGSGRTADAVRFAHGGKLRQANVVKRFNNFALHGYTI